MGFLDYFALFVILLIVFLIGFLVWMLGGLPGRVAESNNHPYARAISFGGWATLFLGVVAWPFVAMWAYAPGLIARSGDAANGDVKDEIDQLKLQIKKLQSDVPTDEGVDS